MASHRKQRLPDNPLKSFNSYSTYFILKVGRNITSNGVVINGHLDPTNVLLLDTRGQVAGSEGNASPRLTVQAFDIDHKFNSAEARVVFGLESTLKIYERGGASYLNDIGAAMDKLEINTMSELIFWVGVGIIGWKEEGGKFVEQPLPQKWFPMRVEDIEMNMRNSGSEYTHWFKGWAHVRGTTDATEITEVKTTRGETLGKQLDYFKQQLNKEMAERVAKNIERDTASGALKGKSTPAGQLRYKRVKYEFEMEGVISKDAIIKVDNGSLDGKGIPMITTSGKNGKSSITAHIKKLIEKCPKITQDLSKNEQAYKIVAMPIKMDPLEETILYKLKTYNMIVDDNDLKPLINLTYFFGAKNEDVLQFDFNLKGAFKLLSFAPGDKTKSDVSPDNSKTTQQNNANANKPNQGKIDKKHGGNTETTKKTDSPQTQTDLEGSGLIPPSVSKDGFLTDGLRETSISAETLRLQVAARLGPKLVENAITIRGNPDLILDDVTVDRLNLEGAAAYLIFDVGTPSPEYPDIPKINRFAFSGHYRIDRVKSIFESNGQFKQEISCSWVANTDIFKKVKSGDAI